MCIKLWTIAACFAAGQMLFAGEVSYQETTRITGGSITGMMKLASAFSKNAPKVGEPVVSTVAVKGDRMARESQDAIDITDLDAKTMTHVDKIKHIYSVMTFEQMKQAFERGMEQAKAEQAKQTTEQPKPGDPNVEMGFEAHVKKTGATKQVSGLDTNETILTLMVNAKDKTNGQQGAFGITNDMWMADEIPGYEVVRDFEKRLGQELGSTFSGGPDFTALIKQAQSSDAMRQMGKEMSQMKGVPVLQVMRMGMSANGQPLPAASEAPLPKQDDSGNNMGAQVQQASAQVAQQTASQEASSRIKGAFGSSLGSAIGGFGGFGRKKKQTATSDTATNSTAASTPASTNTAATAATPQSVILIESSTEMGNFSNHVDAAAFAIPAGYKQVDPPVLQRKKD